MTDILALLALVDVPRAAMITPAPPATSARRPFAVSESQPHSNVPTSAPTSNKVKPNRHLFRKFQLPRICRFADHRSILPRTTYKKILRNTAARSLLFFNTYSTKICHLVISVLQSFIPFADLRRTVLQLTQTVRLRGVAAKTQHR